MYSCFEQKEPGTKMFLPVGWKKTKKGSCWCESREENQHAGPGVEAAGHLSGISAEHLSALPGDLRLQPQVMGLATSRTSISHQPTHACGSCPALSAAQTLAAVPASMGGASKGDAPSIMAFLLSETILQPFDHRTSALLICLLKTLIII